MGKYIRPQGSIHNLFYLIFGIASFSIMIYYLSSTLIHYTSPRQFSISSFQRYPLTFIIFPAELFSFLFAAYFLYLLFSDRYRLPPPKSLPNKEKTEVAILMPIYNEPQEIIE